MYSRVCDADFRLRVKAAAGMIPDTLPEVHMIYLIASDIHGSALFCRKLLDAFSEIKADRLVLLGDLLYHGPRNDLPEGYAPKEVISLLNTFSREHGPILSVRGNCEAEVDQMVLEFPVMADYAVLDIPELTGPVYFTHGHVYNIDRPLPLSTGSTMIYGHTHIPLDETRDGIRFLNPGSVSIPKNGSKHSFLTLENGVFSFHSL